MSGKIFISYRREDSRSAAGRIYDRLAQNFGHRRIFMDVDAIEPGADFVKAIEDAVSTTDIFLVVIGPDWLGTTDNAGNRRLDNPEDFVHLEVAAALERNVLVIPVLVDKSTMPRSIDLPDDLKPITRRNAIEISHTRFSMDMDRLIRALEQAFAQLEERNKTPEKKAVIYTPEPSPPVNLPPTQPEVVNVQPAQKREVQVQQRAEQKPLKPDKSKQKRGRLIIVVSAVIGVLVCCCCAFFWYIRENQYLILYLLDEIGVY